MSRLVNEDERVGFYHIADALDRESIQREGLLASSGWLQEGGAFVTTNPDSWLYLYDPREEGVYSTRDGYERDSVQVDIWSVDVAGIELVPDENETAEPGEDFITVGPVPPSRLRLVETVEFGEPPMPDTSKPVALKRKLLR